MGSKDDVTTQLAARGIAVLGLGILAFVYHKQREVDNNNSAAEKKQKQEDTFESHVTAHDGNGLVNLSPDRLWHVTAKFHGNGPPWRRMIVYRPPSSKSLILLSLTAVPDDVMDEIDHLGDVAVLIIPNSYHRTDASVFKRRYPNAKVACPPGWVRKGVAEVVDVDMDARDLQEMYKDSVHVIRIGGLCDQKESEGDFEYGYEFQCSDATYAYAVTDTLFNHSEGGFMNWVFGSRGIVQSDGCSTTPRVGRVSKWFMHSRSECAAFYRRMSERDDISMILMAHGNVFIEGQEREKIQKAFLSIAADVDK